MALLEGGLSLIDQKWSSSANIMIRLPHLAARLGSGRAAGEKGATFMSDTEYLRVRAQQELCAARNSTDRRTREVHLELADAYAFRARETQAMERRALFAVVETD